MQASVQLFRLFHTSMGGSVVRMEAIEEGFKLVAEAKFRNKSALDRARKIWSGNNVKPCLDKFVFLLKTADWSNQAEAELCAKVAVALCSSKISIASSIISAKSPEIIAVTNTLLDRGECELIAEPKSNFSSVELALTLCQLYFYHGYADPQTRASIAPTVVKMLELYPNLDCSLALGCLSCHPQAESLYARVIYACMLNRDIYQHCPAIADIAGDMLAAGEYKGFLYKHSLKVFEKVISFKESWDASELGYLIESLLIEPLDVEMRSQAELIEANHRLAKVLKNKSDQKYYKQQAEYIEHHYPEFISLNRQEAARKLAVSRRFYDFACRVAGQYAAINDKARQLSELLLEANRFAKGPKKFAPASTAVNSFKDFGLKLLVIEELMYRQDSLSPKFSLAEFAAEYCGGEIERNDAGEIPQVIDFYQALDIADTELAKVTELYQDDGLSGGAEVYYNINPYWDPGCGDSILAVKDIAAEDLSLLPNLKLITTTDLNNLSAGFIAAAEKRGVKVIEE